MRYAEHLKVDQPPTKKLAEARSFSALANPDIVVGSMATIVVQVFINSLFTDGVEISVRHRPDQLLDLAVLDRGSTVSTGCEQEERLLENRDVAEQTHRMLQVVYEIYKCDASVV